MTISCIIEFTMLSDWHMGSGESARGDLDRTVLRDREKFPFIPASTVKGILRDAAEQVAFALDDGSDGGDWPDAVGFLFGDEAAMRGAGGILKGKQPRGGALTVGPAEFSSTVKSLLPGEPLRRALTFTKAGVKIDPDTGTAMENHLRLDEVGRKGAILAAALTADVDAAAQEEVLAFIAACCRVIESVGGKRRRGLGRCELQLFRADGQTRIAAKDAGARLASTTPQKLCTRAGLRTTGPSDFAAASGDQDFVTIPFGIHIKSPVIAGGRVEANIVTGQPCLPGSLLLPGIVRRLKAASPSEADLIDRGIANGDIRVLPAYPLINGKRMTPTPLGFQAAKEADADGKPGKQLFDGYADTANDAAQRKDLREGFVSLEGEKLQWLRHPLMSVQTHNAIDDRVQRPTRDVVGVFVYEGLDAGQAFGGYLRVRKNLPKSANFKFGIAKPIKLGQARGRGYGDAEILDAKFAQMVAKLGNKIAGGCLHVWFESDAIILDPLLQPAASLDAVASELERRLGSEIAIFCRKESRSFLRSKVCDGWIGSWGLPRQGLSCIAAGSTLALKFLKPVSSEDLVRLQREGLGIRKSEGFGVILLDAELVGQAKRLHSVDAQRLANVWPKKVPTVGESAFVESVRNAAWLDWIEKSAESVAAGNPVKDIAKTGKEARSIRAALELLVLGNSLDDVKSKAVLKGAFEILSNLSAKVWDVLDLAGIQKPTDNHPNDLRGTALQILVLTHIQLAHRARPAAAAGGN